MTTPIDLNRFAQIKATGHLPSPRGVALAIMRMLDDEQGSIAKLAQVVKGDPAFVGRLVKAANGALSRQRAIVSVQEALIVLGMPVVRAMALGFSLLSNHRKGLCQGFDYTRFWSSSVVMALTAQRLAIRLRTVAADDLFSIGLLARIGELALATVYPSKYGQLLIEIEGKPGPDLLKREQQTFAMTHAELGAAMLMDWGIPRVFADPVCYFERPQEAPFAVDGREMLVMQCLILARCVADICLGKPDEQQALIEKAIRLAAHLGCTRETFIGDYNEVARQWPEWSKLLQLGDVKCPLFGAMGGIGLDTPESGVPPAVGGEPGNEAAPGMEAAQEVRAMLVASNAALRKKLLQVLNEADIKASDYSCLDGLMEHVLDLQPQILMLDVEDDMPRVSRLLRILRTSRFGRGLFILLLLPSSDEKYIAVTETGTDDFFIKTSGERVLRARLNMARRIVLLQQELEHEREELRHFAAELAISNRSLQEAALTDSLTGLPNRRYALERMQQEWSASCRSARSLACMVIDLDNFKQINDIYGHDVGDMALRLISETLRRVLRGQDVICRTGGDEFLVICPETSREDVIACGERLRKEIECLTVTNEDEVLRLSISVGVAVGDESMSGISDLIKKADRAALRAKRLGRNQVVSESGLKKSPANITSE
ncbi:MAG: diguanylate cyclase [Azoarcus sp.]|nr:diguanylate cyclase [Azoarcus sp.]